MSLRYFYLSIILLLGTVLTGCRDEFDIDPALGDGESNVEFNMTFERMFTGLDNASRSAGNAVNTINSITVVAYKQNGDFYNVWRSKGKDGKNELLDYKIDQTGNSGMPGDFKPSDDATSGEHQAESKTPKATFKLNGIPFGRYYFYVIANLDVTDEQIASADEMKRITVQWNTDASKNNAMFGYFTTDNTAGLRPQNFDAPLIAISSAKTTLSAWVKRTVSKVTVAFDARRLNQNITIYLKDVIIKDIPEYCWIGKNNTPGQYKDTEPDVPAYMSNLIKDGESITYDQSSTYDDTWKARVTRGAPIYGLNPDALADSKLNDKQKLIAQHDEMVPALYFFENIQPDGEKGTPSDKRQDVNLDNNDKNDQISYPNGNDPNDQAHKDARPFGSYIEVHAYYVNTSTDNNTQGDIIYRFMLGQDDWLDYSALRNRHYKLTLSFNGNANDVDWHIVYEEPEVRFPRPYFISYLYNHKMMCPVTVDAGKNTITNITAEIVSNAWAPRNPGDLKWWSEANKPETQAYNGFLSLRQTEETVITGVKPFAENANESYYNTSNRGWRNYTDFTDGPHKDTEKGSKDTDLYYVKLEQDEDGNNIYQLSLPMYTRAKQLIKQTAYTGNNPYVAYQRDAYVKLTITLSNGQVIETGKTDGTPNLNIIQVRRVVNPKGIFREWNSTKSFHVQLQRLPSENSTTFETFESQGGPWKAYVVRTSDPSASTSTDDAGVAIGPSDGATTESAKGMLTFSGGSRVWKSNNDNVSDTVYGDTGSIIDFNLLFNDHCSSPEKSRHAVVRVEYHNYTCYHLIFVRQGGAPVRLVDNGARWHTGNMISKSEEASTPIDEGSLFRFGVWDWPIASSCNVNNKADWVNITPNDFVGNSGTNGLTIVGKDKTAKWSDISAVGKKFDNPTSGGRVAAYDDFYDLYSTSDIEQGYGVLYGDDAIGVQNTIQGAYGYRTGLSTAYGIRGCFAYNKSNGVNLFFPIGNSGYGHRKNSGNSSTVVDGWPDGISGLLRYSCNGRWGYFPTNANETSSATFHLVYPQYVNDCPLFYDIFMRPGAIYYFGSSEKSTAAKYPLFKDDGDVNNQSIFGWDFNYFTFDFYPLSSTNVGGGKDACFVRCVD